MKRNVLLILAVGVALVVGVVLLASRGRPASADLDEGDETKGGSAISEVRRHSDKGKRTRRTSADSRKNQGSEKDVEVQDETQEVEESEAPMTEEAKREQEEEKAVDSFDNLTDKWMEPSEKGVTMADVDAFVAQFKKVPQARKAECLQRALNLVPDENVMLLAGVLMDTSLDRELIELVYNDVLNRDEDVKAPILQQIFKDKEHPCWADTAWILDVTDGTPKESKE